MFLQSNPFLCLTIGVCWSEKWWRATTVSKRICRGSGLSIFLFIFFVFRYSFPLSVLFFSPYFLFRPFFLYFSSSFLLLSSSFPLPLFRVSFLFPFPLFLFTRVPVFLLSLSLSLSSSVSLPFLPYLFLSPAFSLPFGDVSVSVHLHKYKTMCGQKRIYSLLKPGEDKEFWWRLIRL